QSLRGHADRNSRDQTLGQRRILYAYVAKALKQARGCAKHAAVDADVLAEYDNRRVVLHLPRMGLVDGFDHRQLRHLNSSLSGFSDLTRRSGVLPRAGRASLPVACTYGRQK